MSRAPLSKQASSLSSSSKATEKSCVNNEPKPDPSPELYPQSSTCGGKPKLCSAGVSTASLLQVMQTLPGKGGDVICAGSYREEHTDSRAPASKYFPVPLQALQWACLLLPFVTPHFSLETYFSSTVVAPKLLLISCKEFVLWNILYGTFHFPLFSTFFSPLLSETGTESVENM